MTIEKLGTIVLVPLAIALILVYFHLPIGVALFSLFVGVIVAGWLMVAGRKKI